MGEDAFRHEQNGCWAVEKTDVMDSGAGGLGVKCGELEFALRIVAQDEGYPAIAEMAIAVVEDDGFGLWWCGHNDLMSGDA